MTCSINTNFLCLLVYCVDVMPVIKQKIVSHKKLLFVCSIIKQIINKYEKHS